MKILFITAMWHGGATPLSPKVCNYFVKSWKELGHDIVVVHYRSVFPRLYYRIAQCSTWLRNKICGDQCYATEALPTDVYEENGVCVLSAAIFKYIPHGRFSGRTLNKHARLVSQTLKERNFEPEVIIGHFCNPTLPVIERLKPLYPHARTAVVLHEGSSTLKHVLGKRAEDRLNSLDAVGFRSVDIQEDVQKAFPLKNHAFMCYSGVAESFVNKERRVREWQENERRKFVFVGRLVQYKYPKVLAEALLRVYPDKDFGLTYVGSKDNAYEETARYCDDNGVRAEFLGKIDREEIIRMYDDSACFVMVSDHEVFGLVYLEAMSRGCITVAGDNGGMVGIIEDGVNGFLCKPGDVDALSLVLQKIQSMTPEECAMMSENAIATAERFTDKKVAEHYLNQIRNTEK